MLSNHDLMAISELLDKKIKPINTQIEDLRNETSGMRHEINSMHGEINGIHKEMNSMRHEMNAMHGEINSMHGEINGIHKEMNSMHGEINGIRLLLENDLIPRVSNIESCYTSTYQRYSVGADEMEAMKADVDIIKKVVNEHSRILQLQGNV